MAKRHQRHAQGAVNRAKLVFTNGQWTVEQLPKINDPTVGITAQYTGSGSGNLILYTVPAATPGAAATASITLAFAGAGSYTLAGSLPAGTLWAGLQDSLGAFAYSLI